MKNKTLIYAIPVLLLVTMILGACQLAPAANAQNTITPAETAGSLRRYPLPYWRSDPRSGYGLYQVGIHTEAKMSLRRCCQ